MIGFREAAAEGHSSEAEGRSGGTKQQRSGLLVLLFVAADAVGEHRDDLMQVANDA